LKIDGPLVRRGAERRRASDYAKPTSREELGNTSST